MTKGNRDLEEIGLPSGGRLHRLTLSEPASCVLAQVSDPDTDSAASRLFVREYHSKAYQEVPPPPRCNDFRDLVVSPIAPVCFFLGMRWGTQGGEFLGIYRITLPIPIVELVHRGTGLIEDGPVPERWQVDQLLCVAADGHRLVVVRRQDVRDGRRAFRGEYSLCIFDPRDGSMEVLAGMATAWA